MCFDNLIWIDTQKHIGQTNHAEQIMNQYLFALNQLRMFTMLIMLNVTIRNFCYYARIMLEIVSPILGWIPQMCLWISRLGLRRRGKHGRIRLKSHMDIIRPTRACQENLIQIKLESHLSDYQLGKHITLALMNMQFDQKQGGISA